MYSTHTLSSLSFPLKIYTIVYNKQTFLSKPKEEQKTKLGKIVLIEPLKNETETRFPTLGHQI